MASPEHTHLSPTLRMATTPGASPAPGSGPQPGSGPTPGSTPGQPNPTPPSTPGQSGSSGLGEPAPGEPGVSGDPLPGGTPAPGGAQNPGDSNRGYGPDNAAGGYSPDDANRGYGVAPQAVTGPPSSNNNDDKKKQPEPPQDVKDARTAWMWTALLQAILGVLTGIEVIANPSILDTAIKQAKDMYGMSTEDVSNSAIASVSGMMIAVFYIVASLVAVLLIRQFVKGKKWTRFLLILGSAYLIVNGVSGAFAVPDVGSNMFVWATGSLGIVSAVLSAVGIWFSTRPPASDYLRGSSPKDGTGDSGDESARK
ncbi:hypothetical protein Q0N40_09815 [Corynebacterium pseudokroppenstedtii]|uniref:Uncharacterized protein n=1 Tax=Corynebacterium pseudokroppenstedtii TaxID=2804917 RepID=A0AAU0PZV6_9CORY|nr:hypothetical protein [Corynebacterium pseudokroppenstedtii]QRP14223.1 hypothetical protein I6J24_09125 [Corynebacterium kroppenstedtii]MBY0790355.1 hypothetical protein [Corynebacterium pseudokroppenstedtii]MCF6793103.1 hypothetical protein [Corynebacterium pseudokroppenstedtii]MCF8702099.1 hypothetical protein [Corynebacterium pseudokroppenstedtii]MCG2635756.1 hypothetical protein [Corynebacterium pseudokroppenstedtii]